MFGIRRTLSSGAFVGVAALALLAVASAPAASGRGSQARPFLTGAHARGQRVRTIDVMPSSRIPARQASVGRRADPHRREGAGRHRGKRSVARPGEACSPRAAASNGPPGASSRRSSIRWTWTRSRDARRSRACALRTHTSSTP